MHSCELYWKLKVKAQTFLLRIEVVCTWDKCCCYLKRNICCLCIVWPCNISYIHDLRCQHTSPMWLHNNLLGPRLTMNHLLHFCFVFSYDHNCMPPEPGNNIQSDCRRPQSDIRSPGAVVSPLRRWWPCQAMAGDVARDDSEDGIWEARRVLPWYNVRLAKVASLCQIIAGLFIVLLGGIALIVEAFTSVGATGILTGVTVLLEHSVFFIVVSFIVSLIVSLYLTHSASTCFVIYSNQ